MEEYYFRWPDYLVLAIMLALSAAIGFYYACSGDKQRTTKEYLLADRSMSWFPVACSLIASYLSPLNLMGLPAEVYGFGTIYVLSFLFNPIGIFIATKLYIPMFRQINCVSIYRYVEMRFGKAIKLMELLSGLFIMILYSALVIYGPALSISAVTGLNIWLSVLSVSIIAIIYTVLGGMKAVLWTDTLQLFIMVVGIIFVLVMGTINEGGFNEIWRVNERSGRLDMLEPSKLFDFDPRARHTLYGIGVQSVILNINIYGVSQISVQRALSLKSSRDVTLAYTATLVAVIFLGIAGGFMGLIIFAHNKLCDPIEAGILISKDQLYPMYVMKILGHLPGLPGLLLSSLFSASLSTISSALNSGATILLQDFVRPCKPNLSDKHAAIVSKVLSLGLGVLSIALVLFAKYAGSGLLSMMLAIGGVLTGPQLAVFTMGMLMPVINHKGAVIGFICGGAYSALIGFGGLINRPYVYEYPTTTIGCNVTDVNLLANMSSPVYDPSTWDPQSHYRSGVSALFDISYVWSSAGGFIVTVITSLIFSLILARKSDPLVDSRLLSPLVLKNCCLMPKSWRARIDFENADRAYDSQPIASDPNKVYLKGRENEEELCESTLTQLS